MSAETAISRLIEIFYSYASTEDGVDEKLQKQLEKHLGILKRQGKISNWHKRNILPGQVVNEEVKKHLTTAHIILLLISPDFVNSDDCWDIEMSRALERQKEEKTLVIPVLLRPVDYKEAPFYHLRVLPKNGRPVTMWDNQDEAFADIAHNIRLLAEKFEQTQKISWRNLGIGITMAMVVSTLLTSSETNPQQTSLQTSENPDNEFIKTLLPISAEIQQCEQDKQQYEREIQLYAQEIQQYVQEMQQCEQEVQQCAQEAQRCEQEVQQCTQEVQDYIKAQKYKERRMFLSLLRPFLWPTSRNPNDSTLANLRRKQIDAVTKQVDAARKQTDAVNKHGGILIKHSNALRKHSDTLRKHNDVLRRLILAKTAILEFTQEFSHLKSDET